MTSVFTTATLSRPDHSYTGIGHIFLGTIFIYPSILSFARVLWLQHSDLRSFPFLYPCQGPACCSLRSPVGDGLGRGWSGEAAGWSPLQDGCSCLTCGVLPDLLRLEFCCVLLILAHESFPPGSKVAMFLEKKSRSGLWTSCSGDFLWRVTFPPVFPPVGVLSVRPGVHPKKGCFYFYAPASYLRLSPKQIIT